jgi:hypothetical protein
MTSDPRSSLPALGSYEQALAREEENRLLAYLGLARPLFGRLMAQPRWQHVLELTLAQNAFLIGTEPTRADVHDFIWRLDLHHTLPDGTLDNWPHGVPKPGRLARWRARVDCWRISRSASPNSLELPIRQWLATTKQDAPASGDDTAPRSSLAPSLNDFDGLVALFGLKHPAALLALPVAFTFQALRAADLASGDPERSSRYIPPSAALKRFQS